MDQWEVGQKVCIRGEGTANLAHRHGSVIRITKTLVVVKGKHGIERFRLRNDETLPPESVPYSPYGGLRLYAACGKKH